MVIPFLMEHIYLRKINNPSNKLDVFGSLSTGIGRLNGSK
jgi:hypothetical protein